MTATMGLSRTLADSLYASRSPKILSTHNPLDCWDVFVSGAVNAGAMTRIVWPETGTIVRLAVFCIATGAGNIDLGVYDTTATTRNRLASSGSVALAAASYVEGTISLPVRGGDPADLALGVSSATSSFASIGMKNSAMATLPSGWFVVPLGGAPKLNSYVSSGFFALPVTITEASMANELNVPLILARYA